MGSGRTKNLDTNLIEILTHLQVWDSLLLVLIISGQDVNRGRGHGARGEVGDLCRW